MVPFTPDVSMPLSQPSGSGRRKKMRTRFVFHFSIFYRFFHCCWCCWKHSMLCCSNHVPNKHIIHNVLKINNSASILLVINKPNRKLTISIGQARRQTSTIEMCQFANQLGLINATMRQCLCLRPISILVNVRCERDKTCAVCRQYQSIGSSIWCTYIWTHVYVQCMTNRPKLDYNCIESNWIDNCECACVVSVPDVRCPCVCVVCGLMHACLGNCECAQCARVWRTAFNHFRLG